MNKELMVFVELIGSGFKPVNEYSGRCLCRLVCHGCLLMEFDVDIQGFGTGKNWHEMVLLLWFKVQAVGAASCCSSEATTKDWLLLCS